MKNFLNKELKLCLNPINYIFLSFVAMIFIPNYPCYVPLFYLCVSVFFIFNNAQINRDMEYSLILPIKKSDIVKSRCIIVCVYELIGVILIIPLTILYSKLIPRGNLAGIDGNVAFFGLALIILTVFHYIFFTSFYKKATKPGLSFLFGSIGFWIAYPIMEFPIWFKNFVPFDYFKVMDSTASSDLVKQLPILLAGIVIYILGWIITYKKSAKRFEVVDL